eukprot:g31962.t1
MKMFAFMNAEVPPEANGVWKEILTPSAEKNELFLEYLVGYFVKNYKDQLRLKKKVNLRFGAYKLRVSDPATAYRQCCLWVHFRPEMQKEMSLSDFNSMEKMFCRGAFDRELIDRVRALNPTLKLQDFRFFYLHMGKDQPVKEESQLNAAQEEADSQLTWSESKMIAFSAQFTVYLVNLTALGSAAARSTREVVRLVADACAHCPERTVAIVIGPNVAGHGSTYDETAMEKCQDDCEVALKQEDLALKVRRGQIVFSLESIVSRTRASVHPMWVCMSNQTGGDGELLCKFSASQLWHRRAAHHVEMKNMSQFVLPFTGVTPVLPQNLSKAQMTKQHITGVDLMDKLKENLWKGMNVSPSYGVAYVDLLPYDDSLLLSTVKGLSQSRPKEPQEMVISVVWARGDQDSDKRRANAEWLEDAIRRAIGRMVRGKLLSLDGFDFKDYEPEGAAPVSDPQVYALTFPTAEGQLAMRQTALDDWGAKFARLKKDFDAAVEKHNKAFNPSGFPYKGDGQKRQAPSTAEEEEGAPFPPDSTVDSMEALKKAEGNLSIVKSNSELVERVCHIATTELLASPASDIFVPDEKCAGAIVPIDHGLVYTRREVFNKHRSCAGHDNGVVSLGPYEIIADIGLWAEWTYRGHLASEVTSPYLFINAEAFAELARTMGGAAFKYLQTFGLLYLSHIEDQVTSGQLSDLCTDLETIAMLKERAECFMMVGSRNIRSSAESKVSLSNLMSWSRKTLMRTPSPR